MKSNRKKQTEVVALFSALMLALSIVGCAGEGANVTEQVDSTSSAGKTVVTETTIHTDDAYMDEDDKKPGRVVTESANNSSAEKTVAPDEIKDINQEASDANQEVSNDDQEEGDDGLTPTMRNSINMLNHMTSLTQRVNEEKGNQLFLESAYNSFDNLYPNAVDTKTQAQITSLMDTIQGYRMISVKRERIQYIYEQNRAQALRSAIPNPVGLLSAVSSKDPLRIAASVLYMAIDSAYSYQSASSQADLQFIKEGWELDDAESNELHNSTKNALNYMYTMVRDYDIAGDYALSKESIEDFVAWSGKPDTQLERKISWFETNQKTYSEFGPYWLELAKDKF